MSLIIYRQNTVPSSEPITLSDVANGGVPVDLSAIGAGVQAILYYCAPGTPRAAVWQTPRPLTIMSPPTAGQAQIAWQAGDFANPGTYELLVQVTSQSGTTDSAITPITIYIDAA